MSMTRPDEYRIDAENALDAAQKIAETLNTIALGDAGSKERATALRDERRYHLYRAKVLTDLYAASDVRAQFDSAEPEVITKLVEDQPVNGQPMNAESPFEVCSICGSSVVLKLRTGWFTPDATVPIVGCGHPWHYAERTLGDPPVEDAKQPGISLPAEVQAQLDFLQESIAAIERYRRTLTLAAVEQAEQRG